MRCGSSSPRKFHANGVYAAMSSKELLMLRQSEKFGGDSSIREYPGERCQSCTSRSEPGKGNGRSKARSVTENTALVAPIPNAVTAMAVIVNPRARASVLAV